MEQQRTLSLLRQDLQLYPGPPDLHHRPTWSIQDSAAGLFFRIGWCDFEILSRWRTADAAAIAAAVNQETTLSVSEDDVWRLDLFLRRNFLALPQADDAARYSKIMGRGWSFDRLSKSYLFFKYPLLRPDRFLKALLPWCRFLFTRWFFTVVVLLALVSAGLLLRQWDAFLATFAWFFRPEGVAIYGLTLFFSKGLHEFAHAITARHYGLRVPTLGVAILVFWPLLYTDANESWRLARRRERMAIAGAGIVAELILAAVCGILWAVLEDGPWRSACFLLASTNWITTIVFNINPFMRFDGYFLLTDFLNIENLQERAFALLRWRLGELLFRFGAAPPERLPRRLRLPVMVYAVCTFFYRLSVILGISLVVYHLTFKALGVLLLLSQLRNAVVAPLLRWRQQFQTLREAKGSVRPSLAAFLLLAALAGGVAYFLLPSSRTVEVQGVLTAQERLILHAPEAGRVRMTPAGSAEKVEAGPLYRLVSPQLEYEERVGGLRLARLRHELSVADFSGGGRERRLEIEAEVQAAESRLAALREQGQRLHLASPFSGRLERTLFPIKKGEWAAAGEELARLFKGEGRRVICFVPEQELLRLKVGEKATFYPDIPEMSPVAAVVVSIAPLSVTTLLGEEGFASIYGGSVPVDSTEELQPRQSCYRVELAVTEAASLPFELYGQIQIQAEGQAPIVRLWRRLQGIFVRESVF